MTRTGTRWQVIIVLIACLLSAQTILADSKPDSEASDRGDDIMMQLISEHARCSAFFDAFDKELRRRPEVENSDRARLLTQVHLKVATSAAMNLDAVSDPAQFALQERDRQLELLNKATRTSNDTSTFMQDNLDICIDLMNELKAQMDK